ncbi:uncharacterized protein LOC111691030 [Lucilia cuprina]|uniref:uncharacterized protein LOC111691030 n=1 Tax=Lucilia cuprina TaxID=7375 RepID=UPI001F05823D|nr:uncharacterized protein LOC111691030 [Lucilia cuprina]
MAKIIKNHRIGIVVITLLVMPSSWAQRPSFAGSRPTNGLNQKDKYHSTTPTNTDIQNRFGSADVPTVPNQIPFGQTQKPPVGYPVVFPESVYTALTRPSNNNNIGTSVVFEDRFGDDNTNTISPSSSSNPSSSASQRPGVPLDAHGDQLLIDQLNRIPIDKRPFWFINYQAIEAQRNGTTNNFAGAQSSRGSFFG